MSGNNKDSAPESATPEEELHADAGETETPPETQAAADASSAEQDAAGETVEETEAEQLQPQLQQALARLAEAEDQLLRARAEAQNVRRRAATDVEKARKFALERFAQSLLPVVDSLEKSMEVAGTEEGAQNPLAEGVELCLRMFLDVLSKEGITRIDPMGEPFDPRFHEAMTLVDNPEVEPNSVVDVLQKGFLLHERLVRPAKVVVSRAAAGSGEKSTDGETETTAPPT